MTKKMRSVLYAISICACALVLFVLTGGAAIMPAYADVTQAESGAAQTEGGETQDEKLPNGWVSTPNILPWTFGGFNPEDNIFIAIPTSFAENAATEDNVHFAVCDVDGNVISHTFTEANGDSVNVALSDVSVHKTNDEVYGECYVANDENEIRVFNGLGAGTYRLRAWVDEDDTYQGIAATDIVFKVFKANNDWLHTPNVIRWEYGAYDRDVNLITAEVRYSDSDKPITFKITRDAKGEDAIAGLEAFKTDASGLVIGENMQTVTAALYGLHAGTYYLTATADGSDNYYDLDSQTLEFRVLRAQNVWVETPAVEPWRTEGFDSTLNVPKARALFGNVKLEIIDSFDDVIATAVYDYSDEEGYKASVAALAEFMRELRPGTYYMRPTVDGTADYSGLNDNNGDMTVKFTVFDAENIIVEGGGMPWWGVLLIVIGSLGLAAAIIAILHATGVLRLLTDKMMASIRARAAIDATIASVRAGRIQAYATHTLAQLGAHDKEQQALLEAKNQEQLALESARMKEERKARRKALALAAAARTPEEKAAIWEKKATAMKEKAAALKQKIKAAEEKAAAIKYDAIPDEEKAALAQEKAKARTPEAKAEMLEQKAKEAAERAETLKARAELMREIAAERAEKAAAREAKEREKAEKEAAEQANDETTAAENETPDNDQAVGDDNQGE